MESVKALVFDVFGTVVDWRNSIIREGRELGKSKGIEVDWAKLADTWRAGYAPAMDRVRRGELPWTPLDRLHRTILDSLLDQFQIRYIDLSQSRFRFHDLTGAGAISFNSL